MRFWALIEEKAVVVDHFLASIQMHKGCNISTGLVVYKLSKL